MKKRIISLLSAIGLCLEVISTNLALAVNETVKGDANGDERFTIADVVIFRKWLLGVPNTELANWQAVDFNKDGMLDLFDFCLLRCEIIEKYSLTPKEISSKSKSGDPDTAYTLIDVSYDEAKERFGYPIVECSRSDFLGYKVGVVSKNGHTESKEAYCSDLNYEFTNGHIYILAQDRLGAKFAKHGTEQYEYLGRTFVKENSYKEEQHTIGYYPTDEGGLAYRATFDKSVDVYEIMELIISVEL